MSQYSPAQLKQLWVQAGGNPATASMAVAIALAESGGNPAATHRNTDGSIDRGLWQINSVHGALSTTDPLANARAAVKISSGGLNWHPWSTYTNGAFRNFLGTGRAATATQATSSTSSSTSSSSDLFGKSKASDLKYAATWIAVLAAGAAITGIGLNRALGGAPARAAKTAAKTGAKAAVVA